MNNQYMLLILGNGFDLHCGLHTSYESFLLFLKNNPKCKLFLDDLSKKQKFVSISNLIGGRNECFPSIAGMNLDVWTLMFLVIDWHFSQSKPVITTTNWFDIENIIRASLIPEEKKSKDVLYGQFDWTRFHNIFLKYIRVGTKGFEVSQELEQSDNFVALALAESIATNESLAASMRKAVVDGPDSYYRFLLNQLIVFEKQFGDYVKTEYGNGVEFAKKANSLIATIADSGCECSIETFNYTRCDLIKHPIRHINGDWSNPIFGIDNSGLDKDDPRMLFTKAYRRLDHIVSQIESEESKPMSSAVIYGHSLDPQDYDYFFELFNSLGFNGFTRKKLTVCYDVYNEKKAEENKDKLVLSLMNMFNSYDQELVKAKGRYPTLDSLLLQGGISIRKL